MNPKRKGIKAAAMRRFGLALPANNPSPAIAHLSWTALLTPKSVKGCANPVTTTAMLIRPKSSGASKRARIR